MSVFWIGEPRRHFFHGDYALDGFGPRTSALIIEEGKRPNLTRPMASLAMLLNDWQHVLVERGSAVCYSSLVNISTGPRRRCRPNSSTQGKPDGRQTNNKALRRHLPPPITVTSIMFLMNQQTGISWNFRFDLPDKHTYTPEPLPGEPNCFFIRERLRGEDCQLDNRREGGKRGLPDPEA